MGSLEVSTFMSGDGAAAFPMYFGLSCAFAALQAKKGFDHDLGWEASELILRGTSQLLGLLVDKVLRQRETLEQKLAAAELAVSDLRARRSEDAKANDRVAGIYSSRERSWSDEKKLLRRRISSSAAALRQAEARKDAAEAAAEELKGMADAAAEEHKAAFMELVEDRRKLEAALRQAEEENLAVRREAAEAAEKLSGEVLAMREEAEQKDKVVSAMLRKSKLDVAEKQMMMREIKMCRAKKKQVELEKEKWRAMYESKHGKKEFLARSSPPLVASAAFDGEDDPVTKGERAAIGALEAFGHRQSSQGIEELASVEDFEQLKNWVRMEAERYATQLEQRHYNEIEAFTEQMRIKDERLEALRWQLMTMELDSKQLQEENIKREEELKMLREQLGFYSQRLRRTNSAAAAIPDAPWSEARTFKKKAPRENEEEYIVEEVEEEEEEEDGNNSSNGEEDDRLQSEAWRRKELMSSSNGSSDATASSSAYSAIFQDSNEELRGYSGEFEAAQSSSLDRMKGVVSNVMAPPPSKEVALNHRDLKMQNSFLSDVDIPCDDEPASAEHLHHIKRASSWKTDIHALGVSYKIKRLKQQLLVLERLTEGQAAERPVGSEHTPPQKRKHDKKNKPQIKGILQMISLLDKQTKRYQSLDEKTDDLCRKMHVNYGDGGNRNPRNGNNTREQTKKLERFLEETFQLQRFMVATGQKLMDLESKISSSVAGNAGGLEKSEGFNLSQFTVLVRNLFRDIQRGLELRISRIIGDIEGTLASNGILYK